MEKIEVKEKYKQYLATKKGVRIYNEFKEILYGTPDSLVIRLANFVFPRLASQNINILDVGGGDGKRLKLLMDLLRVRGIKNKATLVEQSEIFVTNLQNSLQKHCLNYDITPVCSLFEGFRANEKFDLILLVHSIYTFDDLKYLDNIQSHLAPGGLIVFVADDHNSFLAKLKSITDASFGTSRKNIASVVEELRNAGFQVEQETSVTSYDDCLSNGALNEDGKLILSWIALREYSEIPAEIVNKSTEHFIHSSKEGKIEDLENFIAAWKPGDK